MIDPAFESSVRIMARDEETFRRVWSVIEPEVGALQAEIDAARSEVETVASDRDRWRRIARNYESVASEAGLL